MSKIIDFYSCKVLKWFIYELSDYETEGNIMTRKEMIDNYAQSMEAERINLGLSQAEMAKELELSVSTYKRIISGESNKVDIYTLYLLCNLTNKFAFEIMGGDAPFLDTAARLRDLSSAQLNFVHDIITFEVDFANSQKKIKNPATDIDDYVTVITLTGDMEDGMIFDSFNVAKEYLPQYRKMFGSLLSMGIRITSNHLHPVYHKDDILLISKTPIRDGDIGVFIDKETNRTYIRKFHQTSPCILEPVNDFGETFTVDSFNPTEMDKWIKFGKVLTKVR